MPLLMGSANNVHMRQEDENKKIDERKKKQSTRVQNFV